MRLGWGQFIRWLDPTVEDTHYHDHTGAWPSVDTTPWLQWTASPPNVVDVDGDGQNEVVGIPNAEQYQPYQTQAYAFMVLQGNQGDGSRAARRLPAFETLPVSDQPAARASGDYYPPSGIPAPTTVNILGDARPEIVAPIDDGYVYAIGPDGNRLWRYDYAQGHARTFASEAVVADLNRDGVPEIVFGTYSDQPGGGHLIVLANTGALLWDVVAARPGHRRQRHRHRGGADDRRPRRRRAARDHRLDLRPRRRRLHRAGLGHRVPAVADRARFAAPGRPRAGRVTCQRARASTLTRQPIEPLSW